MRRPEGFDEQPDRPVDQAGRAARPPRTGRSWTSREARRGSDTPAPVADGAAPDAAAENGAAPVADGPDPDIGHGAGDGGRPASAGAVRAREFAGAAGRRLGSGMSQVASRLREYTPDEDHLGSAASRPGPAADAADHSATVTDVLDPLRASDPDHDPAPIGAGVRAAETARDARAARRRRRVLERAEIRRFTRRSRHRRAAWLTAGVVVAVLGVSILVAVFSPLMALRTIEVRGADRVDASAVRTALSEQMGTPLARVDFAEVREDLAAFPLIESYVTEEAPPHTLVVTITERTPILAVESGSAFDLVDPAGIVVQSAPTAPAGMPVADVGSTALGSRVFRGMAEVVLALPSGMRGQVTKVTASTADDVTLTLQDGSQVVWGSPDHSDAKGVLLAALVQDHGTRNPGQAVEYDVSAPDNGIIRPAS